LIICPVCQGQLSPGIRTWHLCCESCGYEGSTLVPSIQNRPDAGDIDETERERGLGFLRNANFQRLSDRLNRLIPSGSRPKVLDVGCSHGWFIELNRARYDLAGVEPDLKVAASAAARGLPVRNGYFPDVLSADERYDAIVFNDVLEHIPDVNSILQACSAHLSANGVVVINAPSRKGVLYSVARVLARFGMTGPFDRLWQLGLPSPHVHYFDRSTVTALARANGFVMESSMHLPSVLLSGLYDRIHCSGQVSKGKAAALTAAIALSYPLIRILPPDIEVWFLRKANAS
jgi:SAM-dependent methyltransferase